MGNEHNKQKNKVYQDDGKYLIPTKLKMINQQNISNSNFINNIFGIDDLGLLSTLYWAKDNQNLNQEQKQIINYLINNQNNKQQLNQEGQNNQGQGYNQQDIKQKLLIFKQYLSKVHSNQKDFLEINEQYQKLSQSYYRPAESLSKATSNTIINRLKLLHESNLNSQIKQINKNNNNKKYTNKSISNINKTDRYMHTPQRSNKQNNITTMRQKSTRKDMQESSASKKQNNLLNKWVNKCSPIKRSNLTSSSRGTLTPNKLNTSNNKSQYELVTSTAINNIFGLRQEKQVSQYNEIEQNIKKEVPSSLPYFQPHLFSLNDQIKEDFCEDTFFGYNNLMKEKTKQVNSIRKNIQQNNFAQKKIPNLQLTSSVLNIQRNQRNHQHINQVSEIQQQNYHKYSDKKQDQKVNLLNKQASDSSKNQDKRKSNSNNILLLKLRQIQHSQDADEEQEQEKQLYSQYLMTRNNQNNSQYNQFQIKSLSKNQSKHQSKYQNHQFQYQQQQECQQNIQNQNEKKSTRRRNCDNQNYRIHKQSIKSQFDNNELKQLSQNVCNKQISVKNKKRLQPCYSQTILLNLDNTCLNTQKSNHTDCHFKSKKFTTFYQPNNQFQLIKYKQINNQKKGSSSRQSDKMMKNQSKTNFINQKVIPHQTKSYQYNNNQNFQSSQPSQIIYPQSLHNQSPDKINNNILFKKISTLQSELSLMRQKQLIEKFQSRRYSPIKQEKVKKNYKIQQKQNQQSICDEQESNKYSINQVAKALVSKHRAQYFKLKST